jgi:hypothetical protein
MEEVREQPTIMPATVLNGTEGECAMSEVGSQGGTDLGKFKSVQALMDAYVNLQSEFTKKCQMLSELKKDKISQEEKVENSDNLTKNEEKSEIFDEKTSNNENLQVENENSEESLEKFLSENSEANGYVEEIKKRFSSTSTQKQNPYSVAWGEVVLSHLKDGTAGDPIINQFILSDEKIKNKIIEDYISSLAGANAPIVMSSQSGERLSGVMPDSPKTLEDAKILTSKMFS